MIGSLSSGGRRAVAVGLLLLAVLLAIELASTLWTGTADALAGLEDARVRAARLEAVRRSPEAPVPPPIPGDVPIAAESHEAGVANAVALAESAAADSEVVLAGASGAPQDRSNPNLVRLVLLAEGPEENLLRFIERIERGRPVLRLRAWRIERSQQDPALLRLQATALAAWGGGR